MRIGFVAAWLVLSLAGWAHGEQARAKSKATTIDKRAGASPLLSTEVGGFRVQLPVSLGGRLSGIGGYPVAVDGESGPPTVLERHGASDVFARVGVKLDSARALGGVKLLAEYEHDLITGTLFGEPELEGEGFADDRAPEHQLRKAYGRVSLGRHLHLSGGLMTSHWGLGLMANDGAHGWRPGSAAFTDPRSGDRVLRLMVATGPHTSLGIIAALGFDWVRDDDVTLEGDEARQLVAAVTAGKGGAHELGVYGVYRRQEAADGDLTEVVAVDVYGKTSHRIASGVRLTAALEAALISGTTSLASSVDFPEKEVLQLGVAVRVNVDAGRVGGVLDVLFASGDANLDDDQQNGFKPDPNFELGLLLYRHVLAGQTARATHTAADPTLVGVPSEDLDRFPTRASASNTLAVFPRVWWRPLAGLELYGGPLFAFAARALADPLRTRVAGGGSARNALAGAPGNFLGLELDVGLRYEAVLAGTVLMAGVEGGAFVPGSALVDVVGEPMDPIVGGRVLLGYRF